MPSSRLSIGEQRILRYLGLRVDVLILDEPGSDFISAEGETFHAFIN
jgi:ABC-type uncharacterized transport system ATPase subunit